MKYVFSIKENLILDFKEASLSKSCPDLKNLEKDKKNPKSSEISKKSNE